MVGKSSEAEATVTTALKAMGTADNSVPAGCLSTLPSLGYMGVEPEVKAMVKKRTIDPASSTEVKLTHLTKLISDLAVYNVKLEDFSNSQHLLHVRLQRESASQVHNNAVVASEDVSG